MFSHRLSRYIYITLIIVLFTVTFAPLSVVHAATLTVSNRNNSGAGSLRQAIADAAPNDTIDFAASVRGTITLSSTLSINKNLTITGPGATLLRISGNNAVRIMAVSAGFTLNLSGLTLTKGFGETSGVTGGGAMLNDGGTVNITNCVFSHNNDGGGGQGGAIINFTSGTLSVSDSLFFQNTASPGGSSGAIVNYGSLTIADSTFANNTANTGGVTQNATGASTLTVSDSRFTGNSGGSGAGVFHNGGALTISNSIFSGNSTTGDGGGAITNGSTTTITGSTFSGNTSTNVGGAILNGGGFGSAILNIDTSTFVGNSADSSGGAIFNGLWFPLSGVIGHVTVTRSTFTGNDAPVGGAIQQESTDPSTLTIKSSTFSGNTASFGGAVNIQVGTASISNSTITGNTASSSTGGVRATSGTMTLTNVTLSDNTINVENAGGPVTLVNTISASSVGGANCSGVMTDGGNNLQFGDSSCGAGVTVANPLLGALANNGGSTQTMGLGMGSPALDAGNNTACADAGTVNNVDQRGLLRPDGAACDIGAYEAGLNAFAVQTSSDPTIIGGSATVDMRLGDVFRAGGGGVAAFDADCTFAPTSVLNGSSITPGSLFGPDPLIINAGYQAGGQFVYAASQTGANPPITTNGIVFSTSLQALAAGSVTPTCISQSIDGLDGEVATPFQTITLKVVAPAPTEGTVSGVVLQSGSSSAGGTAITIKSGPTTIATGTTGADGSFLITGVTAGSYTVTASTPGYLTASGGLTVAADQLSAMQGVTLKAGDVNGDNIIDELDVVQFAFCYRKTVPPASAGCDFDHNGTVNVRDLLSLARNLTIPRQTGPMSWVQD